MFKLYASVYDAKTGEKIKENKEIIKVRVEVSKRRGAFGFLVSKNRKYMLIHHMAYHKKKRMYETHNMIIDENLEVLIDKKETENRDENTYYVYNYIVDNEGSFYYAKRFDASETYIVSYNANKDYEKWEEKINLDDLKTAYKLSNITFKINNKNDILISGFYDFMSEKALKYPGYEPSELKGCFYMKVDNYSKEFIINKINLFSQEFLNSFRNQKQIKKDQEAKIPDQYVRTQILNKKDGGIILIGESYLETAHNNGILQHFSDLVMVNLSPEGDIVWEKRIKKKQVFPIFVLKSVNRTFSQRRYFSYLAGLGENKLLIFYNDVQKNIGRPLSDNYAYCKLEEGVPIMATIDLNSGEIKSKIIEELNKSKIHLIPMEYYQANQGSDIILFAQEGKDYKFGILSFK